MLSPIAGCYLSSRMPSRIFRSSISPFHDILSCVCDLLFSALGFLLQLLVEPRFQNAFLYTTIRRGEKPALPSQRGVPCISGEPVSVALLNCENLSLVDLLCSFDACCWPCSSLPAVGHALLCLLLDSDRGSRDCAQLLSGQSVVAVFVEIGKGCLELCSLLRQFQHGVLCSEQSASLSEPLSASFCHGDSSTSFGATTLVSSAAWNC